MSGVKGATVELDNIGGTPANNILVRPLNSIPSVPSGGYIGAMGKSAPVAELRQALSAKLDVPSDVLSLAYAGRDLNDSLTLRDNGIVEPGAAARRSGARIELVFALLADAVPGEARRKLEAECREQAERVERQRLEREATQARIREENAALDAEQSRRARLEALEARLPQPGVQALAAAAVAQPQRPAEAQPAPAAWAPPAAPAAAAPEVLGPGPAAGAGAGAPAAAPAAAAPLRDNCVLRCLPIGVVWEGGEGQDPALALETRLSARVTDVARQLQTMLGGGHGGDALLLVFRGHVVGGRGTLAAAGVEDGSEIQYYFAAPGEAPAAAGGDEEEEAALAAVAAAEAGAAVAAREAEAQERARRMAEQEAQWRAQDAATRGAHAAAPAEAPAPAAAQPPPEEEDLYGPPEPSSAASGGGAGPAAAAVTAFRTVPALEGEEARALLEELRRTLARPRPGHTPATASAAGRSSERMTEAEIAGLLRRHVPDIGERTAAGGDETPVAKLVVAFYRHGPTGVTDAATKERLAAALRHVLAAAREGDKPGSLPAGHRRALCRRLVEAFQGGQAAQIRIVEVLAEGLAAGADAFSRAALALALEERERALDRAVARMHPEAALAPEQLEQLASLYRQRLGFSGSLQEEAAQSSSGSGIPAPDGPSRAVRPRLDVPAALSSCEETARVLAECLDLGALAMELVADVNRLPGEQEERQVDLAALRQWAEAQREGEGGGREIFYDASKAELYSGRPADESQPFLHPLAAVKVLRGLLLGIGESGGQA